MDYVTVRELREKSGDIWRRVETGEEFIVTRNGKPFALLVRTEPTEVEATLRAHRATRLGAVVKRMQEQARASGTADLTDDDIQAEIDAVRGPGPAHRTLRTKASGASGGHARRR